MPTGPLKRHLARKLLADAKRYPVVTVTGPRQSGKTTLVRSVFADRSYVSLENPDHRAFALEDPRGFLNQFPEGVVLDEVQRAPDLFSYIQTLVDERDKPGQFILTGSQNFLLMQRIGQSLAGRCSVLHLLPFARSELLGRPPLSPGKLGRSTPPPDEPADNLFEVLFKGFYPRIHDKNLPPQDWLRNYYQTYVERDVRELLNVGDIETFGRFIRLCAGRSGQLLNVSSLGADCGISHATARRWLSVLEASFLVYLLRPHHRNFNKRLLKSPKMYVLDTGLLCYLLRIRSSSDLVTHAQRGAVFETFVLAELLKSYLNQGADPDICFWRDSAGHEVDLLVDRGSELIPIEVKSGETIVDDFFKGLRFWKSLPGQAEAPAALVYGGSASAKRKGVAVYSWHHWG